MNVVIVGRGTGYQKVLDYMESEDTQVWAVASVYPALQSYAKNIDRVFDIHKEEKWSPFSYPDLGAKLTLPYRNPLCPNASLSPTVSLAETYGVLFSSTVSWMIATALYEKASSITLLGIDMSATSEYGKQRDGLFFILGQARALGINIHISEDSEINIFGQQYGD